MGAVLAEWEVKKGEREEVACVWLLFPRSSILACHHARPVEQDGGEELWSCAQAPLPWNPRSANSQLPTLTQVSYPSKMEIRMHISKWEVQLKKSLCVQCLAWVFGISIFLVLSTSLA